VEKQVWYHGIRLAVYYMKTTGQAENRAAGYAMAALLVTIAVMAIAMSVALPAWRHEVQREKEEELIFRGRQYVRALQLYQRRYAAASPADMDVLVKQKFLRKKYKDPMLPDGDFEILYQGSTIALTPGQGSAAPQQGQRPAAGGTARSGQAGLTFDSRSGAVVQGGETSRGVGPRGGVLGVRSKSTDASIRAYNGATHYNEWLFVFVPRAMGPGGRGGPGGGGQRGPGMPGGRGMGPGGAAVPGMPGGGDRGGGMRGGRGGQGDTQGGQRGGRGQDS
jgi:type II secretory pathway pseudopilin PulG